jgi:hypothetical protein
MKKSQDIRKYNENDSGDLQKRKEAEERIARPGSGLALDRPQTEVVARAGLISRRR